MAFTNSSTDLQDFEQVSGSLSNQRPLLVSVEGNIGSGKSTFLSYCSIKSVYEVCPEPIEKWQDVKGVNLLSRFYEDPSRWAMTFQLHVSMTMLDLYQRPTSKAVKIIERSLLSSRHCFFENNKRAGVINAAEAYIMDTWYDRAQKDYPSKPHAIVYLHTTPAIAYERVQLRARGEEITVNLTIQWFKCNHSISQNPSKEGDVTQVLVSTYKTTDIGGRDAKALIRKI